MSWTGRRAKRLIATGLVPGILVVLAAAAQVYPVRIDGEAGSPEGPVPGIIVADSIVLRPLAAPPAACDATTEGLIYQQVPTPKPTGGVLPLCYCNGTNWELIQRHTLIGGDCSQIQP